MAGCGVKNLTIIVVATRAKHRGSPNLIKDFQLGALPLLSEGSADILLYTWMFIHLLKQAGTTWVTAEARMKTHAADLQNVNRERPLFLQRHRKKKRCAGS